MVLLRGLLYIGFVVAVVAGWYLNRKKAARTEYSTTEPEINLDTLEAIIGALDSQRWTIRLKAVEALRNENNPQTLQHLVDMLEDPVLDVRDAAVSGIVTYGTQAVPRLAQVLETGKLNAREAAVKALCEIGTDATVDVLAKALQEDESAWVRIPAAQGLGAMGGEKASFALLSALDDPHPDVVQTVETILHQNAPLSAQDRDESLNQDLLDIVIEED